MAGTTHLGEGTVTVWGNDPEGHPDKAWKTCYEVETDGAGLFIRTHPKSKYFWVIRPSIEPEIQRVGQVISKETGEIVKTIQITRKKVTWRSISSSTRMATSLGFEMEPGNVQRAQR